MHVVGMAEASRLPAVIQVQYGEVTNTKHRLRRQKRQATLLRLCDLQQRQLQVDQL